MTARDLPDLPESPFWNLQNEPFYTAGQMHQYARDYAAALAGAGAVADGDGVANCAECGAFLELVRPGKHQHPTCSQHPVPVAVGVDEAKTSGWPNPLDEKTMMVARIIQRGLNKWPVAGVITLAHEITAALEAKPHA